VIEPISRGVLDRPVKPGDDHGKLDDAPIDIIGNDHVPRDRSSAMMCLFEIQITGSHPNYFLFTRRD
jgi:hypothetical protein